MDENEAAIQTIIFGNDTVEVTYTEPRDEEGPVLMARTISVPGSLVLDELTELMDAARSLVDAALVVKRDPPARIMGRPR